MPPGGYCLVIDQWLLTLIEPLESLQKAKDHVLTWDLQVCYSAKDCIMKLSSDHWAAHLKSVRRGMR